MTGRYLQDHYPDFVQQMDGEFEDAFMLFYYSLNPLNQIYEFINTEREHEIGEMMGMNFVTVQDGESTEEKLKRDLIQEKMKQSAKKAEKNVRYRLPYSEECLKLNELRKRFPSIMQNIEGQSLIQALDGWYTKADAQGIRVPLNKEAEEDVQSLIGL